MKYLSGNSGIENVKYIKKRNNDREVEERQMEIAVYFCMGIIWFLFVYLCGVCEMLSIVCLVVSILWLPTYNTLRYKEHYIYADEKGSSNPLYEKGMLRKNVSFEIGSELKGLFACQMLSIVPFGCSLVYMLRANKYDNRIPIIEYVLTGILLIIFVVWIVINSYYRIFYKNSFKYVESSEGIWQPFKFVTEAAHMGNYSPFHCRYHVKYDCLKENLKKEAANRGYCLCKEYVGSENEINFFLKKTQEKIQIFELVHIKRYTNEEEEYLNKIFAEFWKTYLKDIQINDSVELIFLLCVDEKTSELQDRYLNVRCVYHKKGRYRLPAVLVYEPYETFDIVANNTERRYYNEYRIMRRELMGMLQIGLKDEGEDVYFDEEGKRIDETWLE